MKKRFPKIIQFWNEDRSLTVSLLFLLLFIFVIVPLFDGVGGGEVVIKIIYSFMLITGILSVAKNKRYVIIISIFAGIAFMLNWLSDVEPTRPILIINDFASILFNLFFTWAILIKTFQEGEINFQRILGSIVAYLLMGLTFTFAFQAIFLLAGSASFNNVFSGSINEFLYYSFTTLTTMGYGDITPVHPLARSMANFESVIGQLYPAILIARLVSMEFEASNRKKEKK